jgi:Bacterial regulatory helix-turn-helix protein, lysR family
MALVTFRQVRYFIAVAESGQISAAASMLGISPSVVTEAVSELETLSRMKLFSDNPAASTSPMKAIGFWRIAATFCPRWKAPTMRWRGRTARWKAR